MSLAETAQLLVKLTVEDGGTAAKAKTSIGDLGKTALAVGGAAGFAALTKGALDAEAAQGKFMSATGKSREEAKQFVSSMDGLAGSAGAVGLSFEDITATGTEVARQFQLTGQKGADLTEDFLEFAKVTGQDATGAVGDFDAVLDAFKLPASAAKGLMDELVASNQKFGTDAGPEATDALLKMAPALQGLNLTLDDGVGLLNLFEDNGLNADAAMRGLQTAVKNLKPGETFDDLIAQVSSVEDPTLRAQTAMDLFGTKAGSGLALALHPGVKSLDAWKISAEEAADKTGKAAGDMLTTTQRIQGFFEQIGAGAREAGQQFGPLVTGLGAVVTAAGPAKTALGGLTKDLPILGTAAGGAKAAFGELKGSMGEIALIGAGVVAAFAAEKLAADQVTQRVNEATAAIKEMSPAQRQAGVDAEFFGIKATDALDNVANFASFLSPAFDDMTTSIHGMTGEIKAVPFDTAGQQAHGLSERLDNANVSFGHLGEVALQASNDFAKNLDLETPMDKQLGNVADAIRNSRSTVGSAMDDLVYVMEHPLEIAADKADLRGALMSSQLAAGLHSGDPLIHAQAVSTYNTLTGQWEKLTGQAWDAGHSAAVKFSNGYDTGLHIKGTTYYGHTNVTDGGRATGGPVAGRGIYEVNELGDPEMLTVGSRNFLLMGRNAGMVTAFDGGRTGPSGLAQPINLSVQVSITTREIDAGMKHHTVLQGGKLSGGF